MCGGNILLGRLGWGECVSVAAVHSQGGGKQNVERDLGMAWVLCDFSRVFPGREQNPENVHYCVCILNVTHRSMG